MEREERPGKAIVMGMASIAVAVLAACIILLGVPYLIGLSMQTSAVQQLPTAVVECAFTLVLFGSLAAIAWGAIRVLNIHVAVGKRPFTTVACGLAVGGGGFTLSVVLCMIAGTVAEGVPVWRGTALLLLETVLVAFQSGAEEFYFRGWLQKDLEGRFGYWPALLSTALIFASLHFVVTAKDPVTFASMLLGGMLFGLAYFKAGSILLPWAIHFSWNWSEELLFGLIPNPGGSFFGSLINLDTYGSSLWGGGPEGLNASLSTIIVLLALVVATIAWPTRTNGFVKVSFARG